MNSDKHVWWPSLVGSLFPQLSPSGRPAFRVNLAILLCALLAFVLLRWQIAAIAVGVLGFPLIFADYLVETSALRGRPRWTWIAAITLGFGLGVGWAVGSGVATARNYGLDIGAGVAGGPNADSLAVPLIAVVLMAVPAVVVRFFRSGGSAALDGFVVGVLGATSFGVGATLVRLGPQLATGLAARHRPLEGLLVEAGIRGVVIPLTSAAAGGIVGLALWSSGSGLLARRRPLLVAVALVALAVVGTRLPDVAALSIRGQLLLNVVVMVVALLVLRVSLHFAVLQDKSGSPTAPSTPRAAGVFVRPVARLVAGLVVAVGFFIAASMLLTPAVARYACPPECGSPPTGTPVEVKPRFTAADGAFSVSYPPIESGYDAKTGATGVEAKLGVGDGGVLRLFGEAARGRSAEQVVRDFIGRVQPDAVRGYVIPNAMLGYQLGYGEVDDAYPVSASGDYVRLRIATIAAVKNDVALIAAAVGPFHQFGPNFGPGPPSAVDLQVALDMDEYVNSFRWRGDS